MTAHAVVIDVEMVGVEEARRRVLELWAPGTDLRLLGPDRWLVTIAQPRDLRRELAPGLLLTDDGAGLTAPGLRGSPGTVTYLSGGVVRRADLDALEPVGTSTWFDLSDHPARRLSAISATESRPVPLVEPVRPIPDLRGAAGLRAPDRRRVRRLSRTKASRVLRRGVLAALIAVAGVVVLIAVVIATRDDSSAPAARSSVSSLPSSSTTVLVTLAPQDGFPTGGVESVAVPVVPENDPGSGLTFLRALVPLGLFLAVGVLRRSARGTRHGPARRTEMRTRRGWWARVVLRSPAAGVVRRRHERYVRSLTAKFERRQWQDALSEAIALKGSGDDGWLRLRLPGRRSSLGLTSGSGAGGSVWFGDSAYLHLQGLYLRAAKELDEAGRVDEAAFAYAELLHDTSAAVALLERHDRRREAAELAEARGLDADLQVRLWWLAGDRVRAVGIARARGAFATAVERLAPIDADAGRALREDWINACQAAGDHLGALDAAWPEASLRPRVLADIEAGIALAGPTSGQLFAYLVAITTSEETVARALSLLDAREPELRRVRAGFVSALARLPAADPVADRRVCSAAVRSLVQDEPTRQRREQLHALRRRADPLIVADLPTLPIASSDAFGSVDLIAPEEPGQLPVYDAVTLTGRAVLVAHGDLGVRLLTLDGRVRGRWDVPAHRITLADNGSNALLVREAGSTRDIHHLDLATRRVRAWAVLRLAEMLPSYDGGVATVVDDDGIALVDVLSARPRVLWRELDNAHRVLRINRTARRLTALVDVPAPLPGAERSLHLLVWDLPSMTLRLRRRVPTGPFQQDAAPHGDGVTVLEAVPSEDPKLVYYGGHRQPVVSAAASRTSIVSSGAAFVTQRTLDDGRTLLTVDLDDRPLAAYATFPAGAHDITVREHAGIVTISDRQGRVVAADPTDASPLAQFRTLL